MTDQILIFARFSLTEKPLVCHVHGQAKGQPDSAQIHFIQCQQPLINHLIHQIVSTQPQTNALNVQQQTSIKKKD